MLKHFKRFHGNCASVVLLLSFPFSPSEMDPPRIFFLLFCYCSFKDQTFPSLSRRAFVRATYVRLYVDANLQVDPSRQMVVNKRPRSSTPAPNPLFPAISPFISKLCELSIAPLSQRRFVASVRFFIRNSYVRRVRDLSALAYKLFLHI